MKEITREEIKQIHRNLRDWKKDLAEAIDNRDIAAGDPVMMANVEGDIGTIQKFIGEARNTLMSQNWEINFWKKQLAEAKEDVRLLEERLREEIESYKGEEL